MKPTLRVLLPVFLLWWTSMSCNKDCSEPTPSSSIYTVNIKISDFAKGKPGTTSKLLVTENGSGKKLGVFDLSSDLSEFTGTLAVEGTPLMDLHLVAVSGFDSGNVVNSHVGVENGALVYFKPFEYVGFSGSSIELTINGVVAYDSISIGNFFKLEPALDPQTKTLKVEVKTFVKQGNILRLSANNEPGFRYYYLPDTLAGKSVTLHWDDMKKESNLTPIEVQGNPYASTITVSAVSPDFQKAIFVFRNTDWGPLQPFNLPPEIPSDWKLAVKLVTYPFHCNLIFDRNEPVQIAVPDMRIDSAKFLGNRIVIRTSGAVDIVHASSFEGDFSWDLSGSKNAMEAVALPDLQPYLNPSVDQSSVTSFFALVEHFDAYDYPELREGFPYRNTGLFKVARSGYYQIQTWF
ncbi:MAG: hypothetical protein IPH31_02890 [Lewinellaceae bacterium]|nr:hypothetical protein [Lewinellaceae bacterium]